MDASSASSLQGTPSIPAVRGPLARRAVSPGSQIGNHGANNCQIKVGTQSECPCQCYPCFLPKTKGAKQGSMGYMARRRVRLQLRCLLGVRRTSIRQGESEHV